MFEDENSPYNVIEGVNEGRVGPNLAYGGRKWPFCWHRWRGGRHGAWAYKECTKCHRRKAWQGELMGPVDLRWLLTGKEGNMVPPLPPSLVQTGPSAAGRQTWRHV